MWAKSETTKYLGAGRSSYDFEISVVADDDEVVLLLPLLISRNVAMLLAGKKAR